LATGRLLTILRPPITDGEEGTLKSVAISPDGEDVATGGMTGLSWEATGCIYIFDRKSARLKYRISGVNINRYNPIGYLSYSRDGQFLIVGLSSSIRVYETRSYTLVLQDGTCFWAEIEAGGKLVTASHDVGRDDGAIHLYQLRAQGRSRQLISERNI